MFDNSEDGFKRIADHDDMMRIGSADLLSALIAARKVPGKRLIG